MSPTAHPSRRSTEVSFKAVNLSQKQLKPPHPCYVFPHISFCYSSFFWWIKDDLCCAGEQWGSLKYSLILAHTHTYSPAEKTAASQKEISVVAVLSDGYNEELLNMLMRAAVVVFMKDMPLKTFVFPSFKLQGRSVFVWWTTQVYSQFSVSMSNRGKVLCDQKNKNK